MTTQQAAEVSPQTPVAACSLVRPSWRALTSEQKVLRAAKARATRAARHTMGPRQKAAVKSDGKLTLSVQTEVVGGPKAVAPVVTPTP